MKARIAQITVTGGDRVSTRRRATIVGTKADVDKKLIQLSRKIHRSVFGAVDATTGTLLGVRSTAQPVCKRALRAAVARLTRETYGIRTKKKTSKRSTTKKHASKKRTSKKRTSKKTTKRKTTKKNGRHGRRTTARRTTRNGRRRRTSRRRTSRRR
jgi:hypothetical protein